MLRLFFWSISMQKDIKAQVKSNKLQFIGVSNFAQSKVYVDEIPLEEMLQEGFWSSLVMGKRSDRLYPGDALTVRQVEWADMSRDLIKRVIARADCEVISTSKNGAVIMPLKVWSFIKDGDAVEELDHSYAELKGLKRVWNPVKRTHEIFKDDDLMCETKDKAEADAMVAGETPLRQAA